MGHWESVGDVAGDGGREARVSRVDRRGDESGPETDECDGVGVVLLGGVRLKKNEFESVLV